ncbi:MAG: hypothetical protein ACOCTT_01490 [archaeon]
MAFNNKKEEKEWLKKGWKQIKEGDEFSEKEKKKAEKHLQKE